MKNIKKLIAAITVLCLLAAFAIPVAAAPLTDWQICELLGMVKGTGSGVTSAYLATRPARYQGAILLLRLKGLEDEAKGYTGTANFADVTQLGESNRPILAYLKAHPEAGFVGVGDNKFAPLEEMTAKQYYKVLLTALGYEQGLDFEWAHVFNFAASLGLVKLIDVENFTINDLCIGTVEALKTKVKGGTELLISKLVEEGSISAAKAEATGLFENTAVPLAVTKAEAINYREIKVTFNKAADADKIADKANYAVAGKIIESVNPSADSKSVIILLTHASALSPGSTAEVTVKAAIVGADIKIKTAAATDGTRPFIVGAYALGNSKIEVLFSEPVKNIGSAPDYKLDGLHFGQLEPPIVKGRVITLSPTARMLAGEHEITIASSITDYGGYGLATGRTVKFTVGSDSIPPSVSVKNATQKSVVVTFSEPVVKSAIEGAAITFTHGAIKQSASLAEDGVTLTVEPVGYLLAGNAVTMTIPKASVIDMYGNSPSSDLSLTFIAAADEVRPAVLNAAFSNDKQDELHVYFSKEVALDGTYTLSKTASNGTVSTVGGYTKAWYVKDSITDKTRVVLRLPGGYDPSAVYTITIRGVTDSPNPLQNRIVDYTKSELKPRDLTPPQFVSIRVGGQSMFITFDEAIDPSTVLASNFYYKTSSGTVINPPYGVTIGLMEQGKTIKLTWKTFAEDPGSGLDPNDIEFIQYIGLKGADGNTVETKYLTRPGVSWSGIGSPALLVAAEATGPKTIVATLLNGENLLFDAGLATLDFELYATFDSNIRYNLVNATYDSVNSKITFTIYETMNTDATINGKTLSLRIKPNPYMTDIFGQSIVSGAPAFVFDKCAPSASLSTGDTPGTIKIVFSEDITITGDKTTDIIVRKGGQLLGYGGGANQYTVSALIGGRTLVIDGLVSGDSYTVEILSRFAKDTPGNNVMLDLPTTLVTAK